VSGEVSGSGALGWLGERTPNSCAPAVRQNNAGQGAAETDRKEHETGDGLRDKAQRCAGESIGAVA
jgi:hypothetical protein